MCVKYIPNLSRGMYYQNSYQVRNIFEYFIVSHINKCNGKCLYLFGFILFDVMFGIVFNM